PLYSVWGMNSNYYVTKMLVDNLTNFDGKGIEDPRADKMLPWAYFAGGEPQIPDYAADQPIKIEGNWRRTAGVDMHTAIRTNGAPYSTSYNVDKGGWYCASDTRTGDTIFIQTTSSSKGYAANVDLIYRKLNGDDRSKQSGVFYNRVSAPTYIAVYHEACFIKAEVLFRQGNKAEAFAAYKAGIKASMDLMNERLELWCAEDRNLKGCPSFTPMAQADIDNYLNNAIGTAADLTLAKIMTQKRIAMQMSVETFNDMRRMDYAKGCVLNWELPWEYVNNTQLQQDYLPLDKGLRRWRQCSHEYNYNVKNLQAIGYEVPGAEALMDYVEEGTTNPCWNRHKLAWSINVWWDSDQE
ncbi:MAG: SusD/RagB family nutrient-binding outer membrane lipoprotein, partial [Muribaculaceae bacterium]|nr:SusD/RagB family nutrient-binding outer membrane lipoprotein [Muribaculaceae bacterium]